MKLVLAAAVLFATSAIAFAAQGTGRTGPGAAELQDGKAVFKHWCAPCHADVPRLAGTMSLAAKYEGSKPAALEDRTDLTPEIVAYFVRHGVAWMPPFRPTEISDAELEKLSAYLSAPLEDRGAHTELLAEEMAELQGKTR